MKRSVAFAIVFNVVIGLISAGCRQEQAKPVTNSAPPQPPNPIAAGKRDEIPGNELAAVIDAHYRGLGAMERYEYPVAARAFREVHERAPDWTVGTINLAIALLNQGGEAAEKAKKSGQEAEPESILNIEAARKLLDGVLATNPDQPYARYSRGLILASQGELIRAHADFARVAELDPNDAHTWLEYGMTLTDPDREGMPAERKQAGELIAAYTKALAANPYLVPAMYKLMLTYGLANDRPQQKRTLEQWKKLDPKGQGNPAAAGEQGSISYGESGKYARIINPFPRPERTLNPAPVPNFGPAESILIRLAPGDRWATTADFSGRTAAIGRARTRFGAGVSTFDVNRDGQLDLYLTAAIVGPQGLRDALLVNTGPGQFEDRTAALGLPLDRAGLGVAAGDFDADLNIDLFLTGINDNRLLHQHDGRFLDVTEVAGVGVPNSISLTARWFDLDQDGDLDLYLINHAPISDLDQAFVAGNSGGGLANAVFRNDGRPALTEAGVMTPIENLTPRAVATSDNSSQRGLSISFSTAWPSLEVMKGKPGRHTAFAALDIDDDRDFDFVITADGEPATVILNDRGGVFHQAPLDGWVVEGSVLGLLVTDVDRDGHSDLVATCDGGRVFAWRNTTSRVGSQINIVGQPYPINARFWRAATTTDLDLDTWSDLVGLPAIDATTVIEWARNNGAKFDNLPMPLGPSAIGHSPVAGFALANLTGDSLPDLLIWRNGAAPRIATNLGNGLHWLAIDLAGRWKTDIDLMRTNSEGLGTRLSLEGQGLYVPVDHATPEAGPAQSVGPLVVGLGRQQVAPLLRVRWPDGVMQAELNVTADKSLKLVEFNRKTGSCPILFTWNGQRYVCLGDFAGAAGLGFLEAPGEYHAPDRDEALAITATQLRDDAGFLRLSIVEPMDEVAYLDHLALDVIDRPPGVEATPDERFAFGQDQPTGELLAWTRILRPLAACDHAGHDVLPAVVAADRRTVDQFRKVNGWVGYTEDHALILDFGDLASQLRPGDEPTLCLTGWVEYPYSQTNYAAATAGVVSRPPVLEQQLPAGGWRVIDPQMGHPAGLTRLMTYNLAGKLQPGSPGIFRIATNMECYWDEAFLAIKDPKALGSIRTTPLAVATARLRDRGYLRESSPDGLKPILPDYDQIDPVPFSRFAGHLTRHGDVARLLQADDDQLCVMGPGDEVLLEFDARGLPRLESGWTRSYVFRSVAYCKDADPFTATSDAVGPLPWCGMKSFPLPPGGERPSNPAYTAYLRDYQTRPAGER